MTELRLAPGLSLDADYIGGGTVALLAKKGAGKTYTGRVMAEEFWKAKVPFVALDPMDAWWGLRSSANGEGEGIPVAIFGGPHGDAPLEETSGKLIADLVVDERLSMVLSLKHLGTRKAERRFALDFLERLYRRNSELVHLMIDEADLFAPQKPQAGDQPLLGVTENIVRRGRNSGIGITLITQRPAVLNKDVLTQVDALCVMRMLGPQDRNAIDDWVGEHGDTKIGKEVKESLPTLATGECWWWVPELGILKRVTIRGSRTFDSSPTRKRGQAGREPRSYADVDMDAIEKTMAETIERAKSNDPKELRKMNEQLQRELRVAEESLTRLEGAKTETTLQIERVVEEVELPVFQEGELDRLGGVVESLATIARDLSAAAKSIDSAVERAANDVVKKIRDVRLSASKPEPPPRRILHPEPPASRETDTSSNGTLEGGPRKVLEALASRYPMRATRAQLGTLAGYSYKGGTFQKYFSILKREGYLAEQGGLIEVTEAGLGYFGGVPPAPQGPEQVREMWRGALEGGPRKLFDELIAAHPNGLARDELGERTGYEASGGTFQKYLSILRRNDLVVVQGGEISASGALFLES